MAIDVDEMKRLWHVGLYDFLIDPPVLAAPSGEIVCTCGGWREGRTHYPSCPAYLKQMG